MPETHKKFSVDEARRPGEDIRIDWSSSPFDVEQFRVGMTVELEHDALTNVTDDDPHVTAKIALAHPNEFPAYYIRLERMEEEAERDWERRRLDGPGLPSSTPRERRPPAPIPRSLLRQQ